MTDGTCSCRVAAGGFAVPCPAGNNGGPAVAGWSGNTMFVDIGTRFNLLQIMMRIMGVLGGTIGVLCSVLFIIGALMFTGSRGKDDWIQKGKDYMIGSILGLVTVLSAYAILRMVYYFLYVV